MKKRIALLLLAAVCLLVLAGCECEHEWSEPDCVNPERCAKCGEYGAAPLGHTWVDPTCEEPATCSVCGKTSGEALGHRTGQLELAAIDCAAGTLTYERCCAVCGEVADSSTEELTTLVEGSYFLFTPEEYTAMLGSAYDALGRSDMRCELTVDEEDSTLCCIVCRWEEKFAEVTFIAPDGVMTDNRVAELSVAQVSVAFARINLKTDEYVSLVPPDIETVSDAVMPVILTCMRGFTQADAQAVTDELYAGMMAQNTGSISSFDIDRDGITYFITDSLIETAFGILPQVAWNEG